MPSFTIDTPVWVGKREIWIRDYAEFRLSQETRTMAIQVRFNPTHVFILNQTEATLYLQRGGLYIPSDTGNGADLVILPDSYYNFAPVFGGYYYGANLAYPGGYVPTNPYYQCIIFFVAGEGNYAKLFPAPNVMQPLNPLPDPTVTAAFTFAITPNVTQAGFPFALDFRDSDYGFSVVGGRGSYVPGTGFVSSDVAAWGTSLNNVAMTNVRGVRITFPFPAPIEITTLQAYVTYARSVTSQPSGANLSGTTQPTKGSGTSWQVGSVLPDTQLPDPAAQNIFNWDSLILGINAGSITFEIISSARVAAQYFGTAVITGLTGQANQDITFPGAYVQFTDTSTGVPVDWFWDFGDGDTSTLQNPDHTYLVDGVYTVTLCVLGAFGGVSCTSQDVYINTVANEVLGYV